MSRRLIILLVFVAFAGLGAVGNLVVSRVEQAAPPRYPLPVKAARPVGTAPVEGASLAEDGSTGDFGHFGPDHGYPLALWEEDDALAGSVTHISIAGPRPAALEDRAMTSGDVLLVSGWAGEPLLGMRFSHVLFSLCGEVFAAADVGEPRPDVRRFVHGNLRNAGWSVRLPVAALPACPGATGETPELLRVWAVRDQRIVYPLEGVTALTLPRGRGTAPAVPPGRPALRPADLPPLERRTLSVVEDGGLRRCPDIDCPRLGTVPAGSHEAVLLDHHDRWTLLVVGTQAGWLADDRFDLTTASATQ